MFRSLLLPLLLAVLLLADVAGAGPLNRPINEIISSGAAARAVWGVHAIDTRSGEVLADVNGGRLFLPASNRKIITTALATTAFRPDDRLRTEVRAGGAVSGNVLRGDLQVFAVGDPSWTPGLLGGATGTTRLRVIAQTIRAAGIERIEGNLVIDPGPFPDADPMPPGWSWEEFSLTHGSTPSALAINQNLIGVSMAPSTQGRPVDISFPGFTDPFRIVNESTTLAPGSAPTLVLDRLPGGDTIRLRGGMAVGANSIVRSLPAGQPTTIVGRQLLAALQREGILVTGQLVIRPAGARDGQLLATIEGAPISEMVRICNEDSNNFLAESLYLLSAAKMGGRASYSSAQAMENNYYRRIKVDPADVLSADGSGLSRKNAITPAAMTAVLRERQSSEWFVASLPRSGHTGTLRGRLGGPLAGRVQAKTGTLDGVTALSGYVRTSSGRTVAFAIFANNHTSSASPIRAAIDRIVGEIGNR
jgi:D-alanyl-D-alanine carboxypeptidase/D-alanyl-D-alanine-endopeptidase (penicillin-binding protein 4)